MSDLLLLDSSAAIRLIQHGDETHKRVIERVKSHRVGMAGHAAIETYSVLTRLPPPRRVRPDVAARLIATNFPESRYPSADAQAALLSTLAARGIAGGAVYDALVALAAAEHDATLISVDRRAAETYRAIGARFELV